MKKITILALHLNYGGIERFITNLANSLSNDYDVEIISTYKMTDKPFFKLNNNIKVKYLITNLKPNKEEINTYLKKFNIIKLTKELFKSMKILYLKKHLMIDFIKKCNSEIVISTRDIHNTWLGKYGRKEILKIGSEHNDSNSLKYIKKISKTAHKLDYFVVVSKKMKDDYTKYLKVPVIYIPNSIEKIPTSYSKLDTNNIISVGRLENVKGFEDLIEVFEIVISKNKNIKLNIVGSGSQKEILEEKINKLNLNNNVKLVGYKTEEELSNLYNESSIFVMTSHSESFGLVLLEAMSHKLPCIAFDSANGACEIIEDNINGYLIKNRNKEEMANKILELINHKEKREQIGTNALNNSKKYLSENIKKKWVDIFENK